MENGFLGSSQMDTRAQGGGGGGLPYLTHSVCAVVHGVGFWDRQS